MIRNELYQASVRKTLSNEAAKHKGAYLAELRFQRDSGHDVVEAVYRAPEPFTPAEVGTLEPLLPIRPGEKVLELRIRSIPVTVAAKNGYRLGYGKLHRRDRYVRC